MRTLFRRLSGRRRNLLVGDRAIEWTFVAARIPNGFGRALDFGPGRASDLALLATRKGFHVVAIDLEHVVKPYLTSNLEFVQGDILDNPLAAKFDVILNCSAIEHVGLPGRYGVKRSIPDGDLKAMDIMRSIMGPQAIMLVTIPIGIDGVFAPLHRVYGKQRLPRLLERYAIRHEEYWINEYGRWKEIQKDRALECPSGPTHYALGCLELRPD